MKEGANTEKTLLRSALDGANHMRRVQDQKLAGKEIQLKEKEAAARRQTGVLKCQIEVAHEQVDRVMTVSEELQSRLDEVMRENRVAKTVVDQVNTELKRLSQRENDLTAQLDAALSKARELAEQHRKELAHVQEMGDDAVDAAKEQAVAEANNAREVHALEQSHMAAEHRAEMSTERQEHQAKVDRLEEALKNATEDITKLELELLHTKQEASNTVHEEEMQTLVLRAELEGSLQSNTRLGVENEQLSRHLEQAREEGNSTLGDMEALLEQARKQNEDLNHDLIRNRRNAENERSTLLNQIAELREAAAKSSDALKDSEYEKDQTVQTLSKDLNAANEAVALTQNERDQLELRLRRDLQTAREASEQYHEALVLEQHKVKGHKEQTARAQHELMAARAQVEVSKTVKADLERANDEHEIRWKLHCEKLRSANLAEMQKIRDEMARSETAKKHAEQEAREDAERAREAEAQVEKLRKDLVATNAELGSALEEIDDAENKLSGIYTDKMRPEIVAQEEFLASPVRVDVGAY
eukprot:TRINITY_DN18357_c0_g1_i1.p1 TRINITY_DN18357_c0_g1~~TRINITY_DN18357_c0_g1_i1.p1  ORF type:complete len:530 (+),score=221.79 TRINITY_DN18357_c0_g1_i1:382-1971(+)